MERKIIIFVCLLFILGFSCCYDSTSEPIAYRLSMGINGQSTIDTMIDIYITNLDFYLTPEYISRMIPGHPDKTGSC